ncbi:MAG: UPF0175 family protein [Desulfurococcales archaeon]|nr:UPF0175 family protein [Desulfurococcales archaeon]
MTSRDKGILEIIRSERVPYWDPERLFLVLGLLLTGRISMGKAAELLGIRIDELWLMLRRLGVEYEVVDEEEAEEEIEAYKRLFKSSS